MNENETNCDKLEDKIWWKIAPRSNEISLSTSKSYAHSMAKFWEDKRRTSEVCEEFIISLDEVLHEL